MGDKYLLAPLYGKIQSPKLWMAHILIKKEIMSLI
jgi:hypothetical protein